MTQTAQAAGDIVARADFQYRWRIYALFLMLFGYGVWSAYDGFVNWPAENEKWDAMVAEGKKPPRADHSDMDILLNRVLGVVLPTVGIAALAFLWYRSRGEYRLSGQTLSVPGHANVPLEAIKSLDKSLWDRKGVAVVTYALAGESEDSFTLRDMVYQRKPTDEIVDRIEAHLSGDETPVAEKAINVEGATSANEAT